MLEALPFRVEHVTPMDAVTELRILLEADNVHSRAYSSKLRYQVLLELALNARPVLRTVRVGPGGPSLINQMDAP